MDGAQARARVLAERLGVTETRARQILRDVPVDASWEHLASQYDLMAEQAALAATASIDAIDLEDFAEEDDPAAALSEEIEKRAMRQLRGRIGGLTLHSRVDSAEHMKPAQAASPGQLPYWERQVDPDGTLSPRDRTARAERARKAHMLKLAMKSAEARRAKKAR